MYEADGIDLTKSEYEQLRRLLEIGLVGNEDIVRDAGSDTYLRYVYQSLADKGLIALHLDRFGMVRSVLVNHRAIDWMASYRASVNRRRFDLVESAIVSAITAVAVLAIEHILFPS